MPVISIPLSRVGGRTCVYLFIFRHRIERASFRGRFFRPITTEIDRVSITKPGQLKLPQAFMHVGSGRVIGPHPGPYSRAGNNHPALP